MFYSLMQGQELSFSFLSTSQFASGSWKPENIAPSVPFKDFQNEWQEMFQISFN